MIKMNSVTVCRYRLTVAGIIIPLFLCSCTSYQRAAEPDSRPSPTVAKRGQKPYSVHGTRYEPLSSHEGFEQSGIASSYGRDFHGRSTSSGEPFDMHAMTAAHKTLPLGVYVRVVHQRSGKSVIVRINDRGPFVSGRIIDLSEGAAEKLGMLQEGLAPVRISALGYKPEGPNTAGTYRSPASYDSGSFTIQVGAFTVKSNAYRYSYDLRKMYGSADVQVAVVRGTTFYRVRVRTFTSLKAAQSVQEQYGAQEFPGCFVVAAE